jgi:hypothetical protein
MMMMTTTTIVNGEKIRIWQEAVVTNVKILCKYFTRL